MADVPDRTTPAEVWIGDQHQRQPILLAPGLHERKPSRLQNTQAQLRAEVFIRREAVRAVFMWRAPDLW